MHVDNVGAGLFLATAPEDLHRRLWRASRHHVYVCSVNTTLCFGTEYSVRARRHAAPRAVGYVHCVLGIGGDLRRRRIPATYTHPDGA